MTTIDELPSAAFIRLDLFPATISGPSVDGGVINDARVVATDSYLIGVIETREGFVVAYLEELDSFSGRPTTGYTATSPSGDEVLVKRSGGCGCGSKLRGLRLYPGVPYSRIVTE